MKTNGRYTSLKALAAAQHTRQWGLADNDLGKVALLFVYERESSAHYFTTGYFNSLRRAIAYSRAIFINEDIEMNIFKSTKLFPNIRGVMLKEKRITLTMSGKANIVELRDGADARCEISFTDHEKTAVINRTQLLILADIYGPETEDWKGKPVVLYGEEGEWFGRHSWGIRVDDKMTRTASKKAPAKSKQPDKPTAAALDHLEEHAKELDEKLEQDKALAEIIWNEQDGQPELFAE
jgi:hypothetical protein